MSHANGYTHTPPPVSRPVGPSTMSVVRRYVTIIPLHSRIRTVSANTTTYRSLCSPDRQRENVPHPSAYCLRQVECRLRVAPARVVKLVHSPYLYSVCCLFPSLQTIPASYPALLPQWLWFSISQGFHMYNRDVKKPVKEACRGSQVGMYDCLEGCGRV